MTNSHHTNESHLGSLSRAISRMVGTDMLEALKALREASIQRARVLPEREEDVI